jgi:hypothetical protein
MEIDEIKNEGSVKEKPVEMIEIKKKRSNKGEMSGFLMVGNKVDKPKYKKALPIIYNLIKVEKRGFSFDTVILKSGTYDECSKALIDYRKKFSGKQASLRLEKKIK